MKQFAYVLYVGFHAKRNLCDKQTVLFCGIPVYLNVKSCGHPKTKASFSSIFLTNDNQTIDHNYGFLENA